MIRRIDIEDEKPKYIPTDTAGLVRDTETQAILVTDRKALKAHRQRRANQEKTLAALDSINTLEDEVSEMRSQITEMTKLLIKMAAKETD